MSVRFSTSIHFVVCNKCGKAMGLDSETLAHCSNIQLLC